jgi:FtsP/CotA-like multicopper oxidase with cupredoxin domain
MIAKTERLALSMGMERGYINGISFEMLADGTMNTFEIHSELGTYEIWEITNHSMMDHPFHQHVNGCQVLSITGGDAGYASLYTKAPAWKDVVLVPKMGSVRILVPVMDYDGMSMFHCHIVEHEDIGMMGLWHIMGESM